MQPLVFRERKKARRATRIIQNSIISGPPLHFPKFPITFFYLSQKIEVNCNPQDSWFQVVQTAFIKGNIKAEQGKTIDDFSFKVVGLDEYLSTMDKTVAVGCFSYIRRCLVRQVNIQVQILTDNSWRELLQKKKLDRNKDQELFYSYFLTHDEALSKTCYSVDSISDKFYVLVHGLAFFPPSFLHETFDKNEIENGKVSFTNHV
jgi:hypothetical protein